MNRKGKLFIISAPSGTGKSTVIKEIMARRRDLKFSVSATTRPARGDETPGVSYHFIARKKFDRMIKAGKFLEYAEYVGNYYGTPKKPIYDSLRKGEDVILDIDVQGERQIKKVMPEAITIFLVPPSMEELERRLRERGTDSEERLIARLERAKAEFSELGKYDNVVVNDNVGDAVQQVLAIMDEE